ncbi:MAG: CoA-disulfide reductase [Campylobacterales bacterium]|nr:CoA-disulfide reductase [Campylobacterales bacterium]
MKIIIIGGIAAGMSAAAKAQRLLKEGNKSSVTVYEMGEIISFGACGLPYFVGDFFSEPSTMIARTIEQAQESGISVFTQHQVLSVDASQRTLQVKNLQTGEVFQKQYDRLMIATGANAIRPPFENISLKNIFKLTKMQDGLELKAAAMSAQLKDVTVIGGGFIGIEVVEAMKKLGKHVRLIQRSERVFSGLFDARITEMMHEELLKHGVELILNESVLKFGGEESVKTVVTDKGSYETDLIVIATGFKPNTAFLNDSGIEMLPNGAVIVNHKGETNIENIYAAGDCATVPHIVKKQNVYLPLATGANKLGRVVGENMAGGNALYPGSLGSACVKVMELEAAMTGLLEEDAIALGLEYKSVFIKDKNQTDYYPNQHDLYIKLIYDAKDKTILGGQTLGKNGAALRINVIAMAIAAKMSTDDLGMMDFCYAPPFSKSWDALNVAGNVAK